MNQPQKYHPFPDDSLPELIPVKQLQPMTPDFEENQKMLIVLKHQSEELDKEFDRVDLKRESVYHQLVQLDKELDDMRSNNIQTEDPRFNAVYDKLKEKEEEFRAICGIIDHLTTKQREINQEIERLRREERGRNGIDDMNEVYRPGDLRSSQDEPIIVKEIEIGLEGIKFPRKNEIPLSESIDTSLFVSPDDSTIKKHNIGIQAELNQNQKSALFYEVRYRIPNIRNSS